MSTGKIDAACISRLKELSNKTGHNLLAQLGKLYIESTPQVLTEMNQQTISKDFVGLQRNAHSLKSSSQNIGATEIGNKAKDLEYYLNENVQPDLTKVENLLKSITDECSETLQSINKICMQGVQK